MPIIKHNGNTYCGLDTNIEVDTSVIERSANAVSSGAVYEALQDIETDVKNIEMNTLTLVSKLSHVGMVIHSTTLDTMEKVIEIYGGTTWEKIEGQFLLGQSPSYAVNSTGGTTTNILSTDNLPSHSHTVGAHSHGLNSHTHNIPALSGTAKSNGTHTHNTYKIDYGVTNGDTEIIVYGVSNYNTGTMTNSMASAGAHEHNVTTVANTSGSASGSTANSTAFNSGATGNGVAVNNMPPYKTVYIWERVA